MNLAFIRRSNTNRRGKLALAIAGLVTLLAIAAEAQGFSQPAQASSNAAMVPTATVSSTNSIQYEVSLASAAQHLVKVKIRIGPGASQREMQLPVWNAVYQIRDFSQYVNWVRARNGSGQGLAITKLDKSLWRIGAGADGGAEIEYEIFSDQPGPFAAQLNAHHAFFNLAQILMYPVDARGSPVQIRFTDLPSGWKIATALTGASGSFSAENYDRMVDSPVEIGTFKESDFDEGGGHYRVVVDAEAADYDMPAIVSTLRRMVASATEWMKDRPYQTYLFLYHFPHGPGGGGMEHAYCTAIDINASRLGNPLVFGELTAHEFFHLWNVKRIRPQSLEPVDYTKENYTRALWFSEGATTTAANIILLRAGLMDEVHYLKSLAGEISELERRPAHLTQSAEESSLDAWLEKYDYYRLPTRSISYYNKGNLLGVLLDLQVRDTTRDAASLRDIFLWMNQNARQGQFFADSEGVRQAAEVVGHVDLGTFFQKYVAGKEEIPWDDFFKTVGLHAVLHFSYTADPGFTAVRNFDAPPVVAQVTPGGEAERAGLRSGDIILELDGEIATSDFEQRLANRRPGDKIHLRVRNPQGEHDLHWKAGSQKQGEVELVDNDVITPQQKARRAAWLRGQTEAPRSKAADSRSADSISVGEARP